MKQIKEDTLELEGTVLNLLPGAKFIVQSNDLKIRAGLSGKMRQNLIKIIVGDKVRLEVSSSCLTEGRITFRL